MSNPFHTTEAPRPKGWVHELLTSGFFWVALILLSHALVATRLGGFEWRVVAWVAFGAHLFSYLAMCVFFVMALGGIASMRPRK